MDNTAEAVERYPWWEIRRLPRCLDVVRQHSSIHWRRVLGPHWWPINCVDRPDKKDSSVIQQFDACTSACRYTHKTIVVPRSRLCMDWQSTSQILSYIISWDEFLLGVAEHLWWACLFCVCHISRTTHATFTITLFLMYVSGCRPTLYKFSDVSQQWNASMLLSSQMLQRWAELTTEMELLQ